MAAGRRRGRGAPAHQRRGRRAGDRRRQRAELPPVPSRALLFDEIAGYRPGRRVLTSSMSSPALMGLALGLGPGLSDHDLVEALRAARPAGRRRPSAIRRNRWTAAPSSTTWWPRARSTSSPSPARYGTRKTAAATSGP